MLKRKFNRGGQIGGKMSRAAFAVMIKFCDLTDEFSNLIKAVEIESEMLEDMDNAKKEEAVIEFMMN